MAGTAIDWRTAGEYGTRPLGGNGTARAEQSLAQARRCYDEIMAAGTAPDQADELADLIRVALRREFGDQAASWEGTAGTAPDDERLALADLLHQQLDRLVDAHPDRFGDRIVRNDPDNFKADPYDYKRRWRSREYAAHLTQEVLSGRFDSGKGRADPIVYYDGVVDLGQHRAAAAAVLASLGVSEATLQAIFVVERQ